MYLWEIFEDQAFLLVFLVSLIYPMMMMFVITTFTNPYWKELNKKQQNYWFVAIFTGVLIPMYSMFIIGVVVLKIYVSAIIYLNENYPFDWMAIIVFITTFIIILYMFSRIDFKKRSRMMDFFSKPLDWWEIYLKKEFDLNLYFKEKEGEINVKES